MPPRKSDDEEAPFPRRRHGESNAIHAQLTRKNLGRTSKPRHKAAGYRSLRAPLPVYAIQLVATVSLTCKSSVGTEPRAKQHNPARARDERSRYRLHLTYLSRSRQPFRSYVATYQLIRGGKNREVPSNNRDHIVRTQRDLSSKSRTTFFQAAKFFGASHFCSCISATIRATILAHPPRLGCRSDAIHRPIVRIVRTILCRREGCAGDTP